MNGISITVATTTKSAAGCSNGDKNPTSNECDFCLRADDDERKFGKIYTHDGHTCHYFCLLFASGLAQTGDDNQGIMGFMAVDIDRELRRGSRLTCASCLRPGPTVGCVARCCRTAYHFACGLDSGMLNQYFGKFRSFCTVHAPRQVVDSQYCQMQPSSSALLSPSSSSAAAAAHLLRSPGEKEVCCIVCLEPVTCSPCPESLWMPCCKKRTSWLHRECIQAQAHSSGYFFKCPLCNDRKLFKKEMKDQGIFIPEQDASWETEPNAYGELLERPSRCDATVCKCTRGRKYVAEASDKWTIEMCATCGHRGAHVACANRKASKSSNTDWMCAECEEIENEKNNDDSSDDNSRAKRKRGGSSKQNGRKRKRAASSDSSSDEEVRGSTRGGRGRKRRGRRVVDVDGPGPMETTFKNVTFKVSRHGKLDVLLSTADNIYAFSFNQARRPSRILSAPPKSQTVPTDPLSPPSTASATNDSSVGVNDDAKHNGHVSLASTDTGKSTSHNGV